MANGLLSYSFPYSSHGTSLKRTGHTVTEFCGKSRPASNWRMVSIGAAYYKDRGQESGGNRATQEPCILQSPQERVLLIGGG